MESHLEHLFNVADKIIEKYRYVVPDGAAEKIKQRMDLFTKSYHRDPDRGLKRIEDRMFQIFLEHRRTILKGYEADSWLLKQSVSITFPSRRSSRGPSKLALAEIYRMACILRDKKEEELEELSDAAYEAASHIELDYPIIMMLHLYRLFASLDFDESDDSKETITSEDRDELLDIVAELEKILEIPKAKCFGQAKGKKSPLGNIDFDSIGSMASNLLGTMLPRMVGQDGDDPQIKAQLEEFTNSDQMKNLFSDVLPKGLESIKKGDVTGALDEIMKAVQSSGFQEMASSNPALQSPTGASTSTTTTPNEIEVMRPTSIEHGDRKDDPESTETKDKEPVEDQDEDGYYI